VGDEIGDSVSSSKREIQRFFGMVRGPRPSCGRATNGRDAQAGWLPRCFACDRPGSRDRSMEKWNHVGDTEFWGELEEWSSTVGVRWKHARHLQKFLSQSESASVPGPTASPGCTRFSGRTARSMRAGGVRWSWDNPHH